MTNEEWQRIRQYAAKVNAFNSDLGVLTEDEAEDFEALVGKWLDEAEMPAKPLGFEESEPL